MFSLTSHEFVYLMALSLTVLGLLSIASGILILVTRATGRAVQTIATQATKLAQKGLAEDISGLVGNASSLVDALNQLIRTSAGIGIFLILVGFIMLIASVLMMKFF